MTGPAPRRAIWSWITYDLANTIFSLNVVSLYFPVWIVSRGATDGQFGLADGLSMLAVALLAPVLGAWSDARPRRMPFLVVATAACVTLTLTLGFAAPAVALVLFALANFAYNVGLVYYDALLPEVSTPTNRGRIGGLGVGLGYVGAFIGLGVGAVILAGNPEGEPLVFVATALLFLAFAIPAFLFVKERPRAPRPRAAVWTGFLGALRDTAHFPGLRRFLVGRFFFADAANTLITFMGIYTVHEIGFSESAVQLVLAGGIVGALVGGLTLGRVVDAWGPKRALYAVMWLWLAVLASTIAIPVLDLPKGAFYGVAAVAGFALGGTWACDRPFMLRLTPPERVGEFYGLYAMAGRFSAVLGPLLWALVVDVLEWGRPAAVGSLFVMMCVAMVVLRRVDDRPPAGASVA